MSKKIILVVEDDPIRIEEFQKRLLDCTVTYTKDTEKARALVFAQKFDMIFLDHDLGYNPETEEKTTSVFLPSGDGTGYHVAQAIPESINKDTMVIIHSWNPRGAENMKDLLDDVQCLPFGMVGWNEAVGFANNSSA